MEGRIFEGTQTKACPIPEGMDDLIEPVKAMIDEAVANTSDELLEKYLNEEPFTKEEISLALRQGVVSKSLIPVLCGTNQIGISIILNSMVAFFSASGDMSNSYIIHNNLTETEFDYKEQCRNYCILRNDWKIIRIISGTDYWFKANIFSKEQLLQIINFAKNYLQYTLHSWIYIDLDKDKIIATNYENTISNLL